MKGMFDDVKRVNADVNTIKLSVEFCLDRI